MNFFLVIQKTKASFSREVVQRVIEPGEHPFEIAANWDLEPDFLIQTFVLKKENEVENDPVSRVFRHEVQKFIRLLMKQVTTENENKIKSITQQLEELFLVSFTTAPPTPVTASASTSAIPTSTNSDSEPLNMTNTL